MNRSLDHLMATHDIANDLRKAGKPTWKHKIRVFLADLETFEQRRDAWANTLRASSWIKSMDEFDEVRDAIEELAETSDPNEFDHILSEIYDAADIDRTWINVQH